MYSGTALFMHKPFFLNITFKTGELTKVFQYLPYTFCKCLTYLS
jgi:hypothetical protein